MDFLLRLEQLGFSEWIRESSSIFAFPTVLLLHTIGMGVAVGISAGIDLRILGIAPALPLAPMEKFIPLLWIGFWVNAATGVVLVIADATRTLTNPDFYVKMVFIGLGLLAVAIALKKDELKRASLVVLFLAALITIATYLTGNAAQAALENRTDLSQAAIRTHEGAAFWGFVFIEITGFMAWLGLWY